MNRELWFIVWEVSPEKNVRYFIFLHVVVDIRHS